MAVFRGLTLNLYTINPNPRAQVAGMLRLVLSPIEEELPFLTGLTLSLLDRPYLDFDIRWAARACC